MSRARKRWLAFAGAGLRRLGTRLSRALLVDESVAREEALAEQAAAHELAGRAAVLRGGVAKAAQLQAYFAGSPVEFDVPLSLLGTDFQQRVWNELREIPLGETISYGELARRLGAPGASRAVGLANGRNPVSIVVPCHRVIGANGRLTGYGGGLQRKAWLLRHEAEMCGGSPARLFAEPPAAA